MNDFRVRRFSPKGLRNPLLVIEKQDPLFNSLVAMTKQNPLEMPPLLDNDVLPQKARGLLRTKGPMKTDTSVPASMIQTPLLTGRLLARRC